MDALESPGRLVFRTPKIFEKYLWSSETRSNPKFKNNRLLRVTDSNGVVAKSVAEEKLVFREMFCEQLDGKNVQFSELIKADRDSHRPSGFWNVDIDVVSKCLPSFMEVANSFARVGGGAAGEENIVGKINSVFPCLMACLFYPIVIKSICRLRPPLQWRGGMLHELYKNKGSSADKKCYRDIMLGNICGKGVSKIIRSRILVAINKLDLILTGDGTSTSEVSPFDRFCSICFKILLVQ